MSADDQTGRITVSEDKLYRALAEFKNDLLESLSTRFEAKADLVHLTDARKQVVELERRVSRLERWRSYLAGAVAAVVLAAGLYVQYYH